MVPLILLLTQQIVAYTLFNVERITRLIHLFVPALTPPKSLTRMSDILATIIVVSLTSIKLLLILVRCLANVRLAADVQMPPAYLSPVPVQALPAALSNIMSVMVMVVVRHPLIQLLVVVVHAQVAVQKVALAPRLYVMNQES